MYLNSHIIPDICFEIQSNLLNSYSLNSSFSLNLSGKFENFETITIDISVKSTF